MAGYARRGRSSTAGKGLSLMEQVVLNEEFAKAKAPLRADFFGDTLVGPTILQWGTEEQKRSFIPRILDGTISWCQGFSEPDSGSDLASLKTRAELDGDEWVINGQKVWTTQAQFADYIFLLARTDPDAPKHAGHLVPAGADEAGGHRGAADRADRQLQRVQRGLLLRCSLPARNVVGGVNNGWKVAMTTLGFERGASATTGYRRFAASSTGSSLRPGALGRVTGSDRPPGPGAGMVEGEDHGGERLQEPHRFAQRHTQRRRTRRGQQDVLVRVPPRDNGARHLHTRARRTDPHRIHGARRGGFERLLGRPARQAGFAALPRQPASGSYFFSVSETIWGGTAEIQRNIVGERVLGLPKEPKP